MIKVKREEMTGQEDVNTGRESVRAGRAYLSLLRALKGRWMQRVREVVGVERQVGVSSASLLASATRVSHGMQWHQTFNEHAAKKEERCPPGHRAGALNWSSAAHKCRGIEKKTTKNKS